MNVMAEILKTKDVPGLMRQYGGCTCDKCIADVTALSLTRLPAKYVVLEKEKTSPMIGFYQSKFRSDIFVAMLRATLDVKSIRTMIRKEEKIPRNLMKGKERAWEPALSIF